MISLAKYLRFECDGEDLTYLRAVRLLIHGMELHTLDHDREDHARFRSGMSGLQRRLVPEAPAADLLGLVGDVILTFEAYNRRTGGKLRAQFSERQSIIAVFSGAVAAMVSASDASLERLKDLRLRLEKAEGIADLRLVKTHLEQCLNGIAAEVEEHRRQSASGMQRLAEGARELENSIQHARRTAPDPVTGLPPRAEAEGVLARLGTGGVAAVAAVFALKRLKQVNSRFGHAVGGLLRRASTYLGSGMNPEEGLYRWSGPALLAITSRIAPFDLIRQDIEKLIAGLPKYEVTIGTRAALIPVSVGWAAFPLTRPAERLIRQLDVFVNSQTPEDFAVVR